MKTLNAQSLDPRTARKLALADRHHRKLAHKWGDTRGRGKDPQASETARELRQARAN